MTNAHHRYTIEYREADHPGPGGWQRVATARTVADVAEELASWMGPRPRDGDIALVTALGQPERLYVFGRSGWSAARPANPAPTHNAPDNRPPVAASWLGRWEGPRADPVDMARIAVKVLPNRALPLALAGGRFAVGRLAPSPAKRELSQNLDAAEAWSVRGEYEEPAHCVRRARQVDKSAPGVDGAASAVTWVWATMLGTHPDTTLLHVDSVYRGAAAAVIQAGDYRMDILASGTRELADVVRSIAPLSAVLFASTFTPRRRPHVARAR